MDATRESRALTDIDRLRVLNWIEDVFAGALWDETDTTRRIADEQRTIIASASRVAEGDSDIMIEWLSHNLAKARLAIHYEETRKAWLRVGR